MESTYHEGQLDSKADPGSGMRDAWAEWLWFEVELSSTGSNLSGPIWLLTGQPPA